MSTSPDEQGLARLLDEAAIRDVTARFADAATRGDDDAFRATWAPDAVWTIAEHVHATGVEDIVATFQRLRAGKEFFVQFAIQGPITVDGDEATTSILCHEAAIGPGATYYRNHAMTVDRLRRTPHGWVFTGRAFHYLWLDTSAFTGAAVPLPA